LREPKDRQNGRCLSLKNLRKSNRPDNSLYRNSRLLLNVPIVEQRTMPRLLSVLCVASPCIPCSVRFAVRKSTLMQIIVRFVIVIFVRMFVPSVATT